MGHLYVSVVRQNEVRVAVTEIFNSISEVSRKFGTVYIFLPLSPCPFFVIKNKISQITLYRNFFSLESDESQGQ